MISPPQLSAVRLPAESSTPPEVIAGASVGDIARGGKPVGTADRQNSRGSGKLSSGGVESRNAGRPVESKGCGHDSFAPRDSTGTAEPLALGGSHNCGSRDSVRPTGILSDDDTEPPESFTLYSPASIHVVYLADRKYISFETLCGDKRIDVKPEQWEAFWRQMVLIGKRELGVEG